MEFLEKALRIKIKSDDEKFQYPLPNYILSRYSVRNATFDNQRVILLYPKVGLGQVSDIRKHIQRIQDLDRIPVVLVLSRLTARQREAFIYGGIPFIVEDRQCYLPFMGTILTERCDVEAKPVEKLLPSAQMLLFYYIYGSRRRLYADEAVKALGFSAMTISRAVRQLEQLGLVKTYKEGVRKVITTEFKQKELFEKAQPYLASPIKKISYLSKSMVDDTLLLSGDCALSSMSMLNPPRIACYATGDGERWRKHGQTTLLDEGGQVVLQVWKYDPRVLSDGTCVDVLSLAMSYEDDGDERIEAAVNEMLEHFWRKMNG